jgi:hypothetical protein
VRLLRFQADNDLRWPIVHGILRRKPTIDFQSAQTAKLDGVVDEEVLARAAAEDRILVSHDFKTMPTHFRRFASNTRSPGVFLIPQDYPVGEAVDSLVLLWEASAPHEWQNRLILLPSLVTIVLGTEV